MNFTATSGKSASAFAYEQVEKAALRIIRRWEHSSHTIDFLIEQDRRKAILPPLQRARLTEWIFTWARMRGSARFLLDKNLKQGLDSLPADLRRLLELAVCRLLQEERTPAPVIVSQAVESVKRMFNRGLAQVTNAVLREIAADDSPWPDPKKDLAGHLAYSTSHPRWIVERWLQRWDEKRTRQQLDWDNRRPEIWLRWSDLRGDPAKAKGILRDLGIEAEPDSLFPGFYRLQSPFYPQAAKAVQDGDFSVQDPSASLCVHLLDPRPGMKILDLCAAPGGKTTLIAQIIGDRGGVVAVDISEDRINTLKKSLLRLGIRRVEVLAADAVNFSLQNQAQFDAVLVDVPCSGFGVLNRRADLRWRRKPEDFNELALLQKSLLRAAARCTRPGGVLVYSTCSIEPQENEEIVNEFLSEHSNFARDSGRLDSLTGFQTENGDLNTFSPQDGIDGVYAARIRRTA